MFEAQPQTLLVTSPGKAEPFRNVLRQSRLLRAPGAGSTEYSLPAFVYPLPPTLWLTRTTACHRSAQSFPTAAACLSQPPPTWECEYSRDSAGLEAPKDFRELPVRH